MNSRSGIYLNLNKQKKTLKDLCILGLKRKNQRQKKKTMKIEQNKYCHLMFRSGNEWPST